MIEQLETIHPLLPPAIGFAALPAVAGLAALRPAG